MNAIDLLKSQHREVEALFAKIEKAKNADAKEDLFTQIADKLAVHAAIEEHHFYPAVKAKRTEDILLEALEEHLSIKRVIADLLEIEPDDETFDAKVKVLKEQVEHHVEEEESDLFPKVKKLLSREELDAVAQEMAAEQSQLEEGRPPQRRSVRRRITLRASSSGAKRAPCPGGSADERQLAAALAAAGVGRVAHGQRARDRRRDGREDLGHLRPGRATARPACRRRRRG